MKENGNGNVVKDCWNNKKKETMQETMKETMKETNENENENGNGITASKTSPSHGI